MPSIALLQTLEQQTSTKPPDRATPTVYDETETAQNIPGRGVVDHGVPLNKSDQFDPDLTDKRNQNSLVTYEDAANPPAAIPVYIVSTNAPGKVIHDFRVVYAYAAAGQPSSVIGQHDSRSRMVVKVPAAATNPIYISDTLTTANAMSGFQIPAGGQLEIFSSRALYASTDSSATGPIGFSILEEFDVSV